MKEIFRAHDHALVGYYKTVLEAKGIPIILRNEYASTGITEIPIVEFYPNICVMNDADYEKAREILKNITQGDAKSSDQDLTCPSCSETNPGNFEICFSCESPLITDHFKL